MSLFVRDKASVHFHPGVPIAHGPNQTNVIQKIDAMLFSAVMSLSVYPSCKLGIFSPFPWNARRPVFIFVRHKAPVHFHPRGHTPNKTNVIQKIDAMLFFATLSLIVYP